ncbi:MAG TPA: cardiolipin synthase [Candidatus Corynebacterium avicola]|uniref:Cardiolipin synthase n=1 Tax=Candidatus Corynebacterium avicola TaxID=2838527 RepID=A0A9D1RR06_9CORY|nr:cardiolipin synthase [Candidatus Corynebacterium avicola]
MTFSEVWAFITPEWLGFPLLGNYLSADLTWWQWSLVGFDMLLRIVALGYVPSQRKPTSAMAWLLAIFLIPMIGIVLFLLMGSPYINRRRHRIQNRANELIRTVSKDEPDIPEGHDLNDEVASMIMLNRHLTSMPAATGSLVALHSDYQDTLRQMAAAIDRAEDYVNVQIYITAWDDTTDVFFSALERAVARGVKVRLMFDQVGSWKYPGYRKLGKRLTDIGVDWMLMLPLQPLKWRFRRPDLRNHRKIVVVDGRTAFMGSQNMIDSSYLKSSNQRSGRHWVDVMVEVTGPIVMSLDAVFAVDWFTESKEELSLLSPTEASDWLESESAPWSDAPGTEIMQVIPSGPGFTTEPNLRLFVSLAHHAKERLIIVSPYFVPEEALMDAVTTASFRGVQVELYVSEKADQPLVDYAQSSYYAELQRAGVHIYQYPYPAVLHTKYMIADDEVAVIGSSNMDIRSFELNYEVTLMVERGDVIGALHELTDDYRSTCIKLTTDAWNSRPLWRRYLENVARLTSSLQ